MRDRTLKFSMAWEYLPSARALLPLKKNTSLSYCANIPVHGSRRTMTINICLSFCLKSESIFPKFIRNF